MKPILPKPFCFFKLLGITLLFGLGIAQAEMAIDFHQALEKECPKLPIIISKKLLVHFIKAASAGEKFCQKTEDEILSAHCSKTYSCEKALEVFQEVKLNYSGNIIGN